MTQTAASGDIDDVKDALAALLSGPLFVSAMEDVVVRKQNMQMPEKPVVVYTEERLQAIEYPSCQLIGLRTRYPKGGEDYGVKKAVHEIVVEWTAIAANERLVTRYVELLVRATTEVLEGKAGLDMRVQNSPILITEEDYSPLIPHPDHPFLKSGRVMTQVMTWR